MNIKKSLNIALAKKGIKKGEFAEKLGVSRARLTYLARVSGLCTIFWLG